MTLYRKLEIALNRVDGNLLLIEAEETSRYDEYFCRDCHCRVYEESYNHSKGVCFNCWYEKGLI